MISTLGAVMIAVALAWLFGGLALRLGGALAFWLGLLGLTTTGDPQAAVLALFGALAWTGGQVHFALRHGAPKSALALPLLAGVAALCHQAMTHRPPAHEGDGDERSHG